MNQPLKDLIEVVDSPVKTAVINLTQSSGKIVPLTILKQVTGFVDQQRYKEAAGLLTPYSSLSTTEMETALSTINTTVSGSVSTTNAAFDELGASTAPTCIIGQYDTYWDGTNSSIKNPGAARGVAPGGQSTESGSYAFTYVSSLEELEAELRSATREITETVIHWTANYIDQAKVGADNIHQVHLQRGFSGCGYHYIIKRDGRIQRGRPINQVGAHAKDFGHNTYSIGISHVAGYNCVSGTPNPERYVSSDSISSAQWKAQKDFLTAFYRVFPGGQVLGHYQCTTSGKIDPGFDVNAYIKNTFNKTNALIYANNQPPLSRDELINTRGTTV
jgi:N-acetylmuramoyl-L-alanine amidase